MAFLLVQARMGREGKASKGDPGRGESRGGVRRSRRTASLGKGARGTGSRGRAVHCSSGSWAVAGARFVLWWARGGFGLSRWRHCRARGCHWPGWAKLMSRFCQVFHVSVPVHPSSLPCATMARPERSRIKCKFSSISQQKRHEWYNLFSTTRRCICVAQKGETFQPAKAETSVQGASSAHGRARRNGWQRPLDSPSSSACRL